MDDLLCLLFYRPVLYLSLWLTQQFEQLAVGRSSSETSRAEPILGLNSHAQRHTT